jgi:hypothetical protein
MNSPVGCGEVVVVVPNALVRWTTGRMPAFIGLHHVLCVV